MLLFVYFLLPILATANIILFNDSNIYNLTNYKYTVKIPKDLTLSVLSNDELKLMNITVQKNITAVDGKYISFD